MFQDTGIISRDLLEFFWGKTHFDFLLDLMKNTLLLSPWDFSEQKLSEKKEGKALTIVSGERYIVPSSLKIYPQSSFSQFQETAAAKYTSFYFDFTDQFLPQGLVGRLICLLLQRNVERKKHAPCAPVLYSNFAQIYETESDSFFLVQAHGDSCIFVYGDLKLETSLRQLLQALLSMLHKINNEVMGSRLMWTTYVKTAEKYVPLEIAKMSELKPWAEPAETQQMDIDLDAFFLA